MTGILQTYLDDAVARLEVQSSWGPTITVDDPFRSSPKAPSAPGGAGGAGGIDLARILKPKVVVTWRQGGSKSFTPYGEPGPSRWPFVVVGGTVLLGLLVYRAFFDGRR